MFTATDDGGVRFHPLPAPTDEEVARVLATVATRVRRLLRRRGLEAGEGRDLPPDPLAEESGALAAVASASVQGRVALGARAGRRVLRLGRDPDAPWITSRGPRQAHLDGFDLHADVSAPAGDRARLEHLRSCLAADQSRVRVAATVKVAVGSRPNPALVTSGSDRSI